MDHNERILTQMRGIKPQPATPESSADPRNPNQRNDNDKRPDGGEQEGDWAKRLGIECHYPDGADRCGGCPHYHGRAPECSWKVASTPANESPAPQAEALDNAAFQNTDNASPIAVLAAVRHCANSWEGSARLLGNVRASDISRACDHAIKNLLSPDPQAIVRDNPFIAVLASLAAAISLLERTPKAKKAAASDKMFNQMIVDYKKALEAGRAAALATPAPQPPVEGLRDFVQSASFASRIAGDSDTIFCEIYTPGYPPQKKGSFGFYVKDLRAILAALASPSLTAGPSLTRAEAMQESAYLAGAKAGWNLCATNDHDGYDRLVKNREGYLKSLRPPAPAALIEQSDSDETPLARTDRA